MELLRIVEARIGRWLAYADYCVNAAEQLARCQPFWNFVGMVLGFVCLIALGGVIVKIIRDRRKGTAGYRRAAS
ncbi:MAG: hypothetical protein A3I02_10920 [Betaproteobacteria bacterium RIFCSPLOWO2_02_FULL_67_26]|nr:MAG: hypothetical protein A3I02_10920 [Betaproteobacteria bacterium RIFCSPLOWO2_02_FULL_67_26]